MSTSARLATSTTAEDPVPGRVPLVEVVIAEGLDTRSGPRLTALLDEALALQPQRLVLDLAQCRHIDAATIGLLLDVHRRTRRTGGLFTVRSPSPQVRRNLQLTRADRVLHIAAGPPASAAQHRVAPTAEHARAVPWHGGGQA